MDHAADQSPDPIAELYRQWIDHGWESPDIVASVGSIMRAHQLLIGRINAVLSPFDLTFSRYEALLLLHFSQHDALPLKIVGERLMIHSASVTNTITRLEGQGLVQRIPHPKDGRMMLARLTPEGHRITIAATRRLVAEQWTAPSLRGRNSSALVSVLNEFRAQAGDATEEVDFSQAPHRGAKTS